MLEQYSSRMDKEFAKRYGGPDYDPGNVHDAHDRITRLEEAVKHQAKLIEALVIAIATNERIDVPKCPHVTVKETDPNPRDSNLPLALGECKHCLADVAVFVK